MIAIIGQEFISNFLTSSGSHATFNRYIAAPLSLDVYESVRESHLEAPPRFDLLIFLKKIFDSGLKWVIRYKRRGPEIQRRLIDEIIILKKEKIEHLSQLLQNNHQRVSASISHISIMLAVLVFSYNFLFPEHPLLKPLLQFIVSVEIMAYLLLAVALLRCLRDFGLDEDYRSDVAKYEVSFLDEITYRFAILRVCNTFIIITTLSFFVVLIFQFSINPAKYVAHLL